MARPTFSVSWVALISIIATTIPTSYALDHLIQRDNDSCPASFQKCGSSKLPDSFCCPSTSTCVSLDNASSAICCPSGQNCTFIEPITCDIQQQNATLNPKAVVKTTRLDEDLPKCGSKCCPFGYTCQSNGICALDTSNSSSLTVSEPSSTTATPSSISTHTTLSTLTSTSSTPSSTATTTATRTTDTISSTDLSQPTVTTASNTAVLLPSSAASGCNGTSAAVASSCPSFPTNAILAGFFPGAAFGAVVALLAMFLMQRRHNNLPPSAKVAQHTQRTTSGTLLGISDPIPSEENAYRTDFLLHRPAKRNSEGARSMLQRTGTRVKSLFGGAPKSIAQSASKPPPLPTTPVVQVRQPSTESIKVYTPPSTFASTGVLKPEPYPNVAVHHGQTFTEMIDRVGFKNTQGDPCYRVNEPPRIREKSPLRNI